MRKFSEVLTALRKEKNLSQRSLAEELNLSKSTIGMYESGNREPNIETLERIADYFNVDMNYLLGKTNIKNTYNEFVISTRIRKLMDERNTDINDLSSITFIDKNILSECLSNKNFQMTISNIIGIADALETTPEYLTGWTDDPTDYNKISQMVYVPKDMWPNDDEETRIKKWLQFKENESNDANFELLNSNSKQERTLRVIRRASDKMSDDDLDKMVDLLSVAFKEAFTDDDE